MDQIRLGDHYAESRQRLTELVASGDPGDWRRPVPACPGWVVGDVVAHLVAVVDDAMAGRLTGPPSDAFTAEQVARYHDVPPDELLARWGELAPPFEAVVTDLVIWAAAIDALSHEHDVRHALDRPGARDADLVHLGARRLIENLDVEATVVWDHDGGATGGTGGSTYRLRTTPFEVLRFRLGRRTAEQVLALDWSEDPAPILDGLFVFGPAGSPIIE